MADALFLNGNILTMDPSLTKASVVGVKNGEIVYVGDDSGMHIWKGNHTVVIDLKGKTLMPSFIESHIHPTSYGLNLFEVNCRSASSIQDILHKVNIAADETVKGNWIKGWGLDDTKLTEKKYPTRDELDQVAPHHPVYIKRTCGHMSVLNSMALELSGITKETPNPEGGHIQKDPVTEEPTGLLQEAAQHLVSLPDYSLEETMEAMKLAQKDFAEWGITTVHDMGTLKTQYKTYQQLLKQGDLKVRVRPWFIASNMLDEVLELGIESGLGNAMLKVQGMKFFLDGSVGGRTAAVLEPYADDVSRGILMYSDMSEYNEYVRRALEGGLRVAVHAIGDQAIESALQAYEEMTDKVDMKKMRNRIEHCALPTKEHLSRMKHLDLVAASSIGFIYSIGDSYLKNLGPERMKRLFPHRSFKEYGIVAPGNSDMPITDGNPWLGIYSAVTRKTMTGQKLDHEQGISVYDALKAYTVDAAYSSLEENEIGTIKVQAKADMIVISEDPLVVDVESLKDIKIEQTYLNGELIYNK